MYLQLQYNFSTTSGVTTTDAVVSQGDAAKLSCQLLNTPKAPDYVVWTNGQVQIEEFTTRAGYGLSVSLSHFILLLFQQITCSRFQIHLGYTNCGNGFV